MKKIIPINRMTLCQRLRNYLHSPLSFLIFLLVTLAALFSVFILLFLVVYILIMGIPHLTPELFAFKYDSDNVSMFPAIITTVQTVILSLLIAAPLGLSLIHI